MTSTDIYNAHVAAGHRMVRHSPNGVDTIDECECGARFLHNPSFQHPITLTYCDPWPERQSSNA